MLTRHTMEVGPFQSNCSVLICDKAKEAIVVDAGDDLDRIKEICAAAGATLKYVLLTHAHLDHMGVMGALKTWMPRAEICLHRADESIYNNLVEQGRLFGLEYAPPPPVDHFLEDDEILPFCGHQIRVLHTPGHSPGGVCFFFARGTLADTPVVFTGDTLFEKSIGRSDLWGGDHGKLIASIKERLLTLDPDTLVIPGHGPVTSIAVEARSNPFL